jgi:hypothetical protein
MRWKQDTHSCVIQGRKHAAYKFNQLNEYSKISVNTQDRSKHSMKYVSMIHARQHERATQKQLLYEVCETA